MTLDWVLPIHSNTSQRALFSWKISFFMGHLQVLERLKPWIACLCSAKWCEEEYGFDRTGAIDAGGDQRSQRGWSGSRRCCDVGSSSCKLAKLVRRVSRSGEPARRAD